MITKRNYFLILLIILASTTCYAQELKKDSTRRAPGTTEVIVFSKEGGSNTSKPEGGPNIVKAGLNDWPSGYIPFYYERRLLPWLSIQAGIGITTRDFVADAVNDIFVDAYYGEYAAAHRKASVGPFVSIQPKFYVRSEALEGFFVSPMVAFKQWNYHVALVDVINSNLTGQPVYSNTAYQREYRNAIDFTVNIGWQWEYNPVTLEFMMGAGLRKFWESRENDPSNNSAGYYTNSTRSYSGFRPDFNLSLNLGGFF